MLRVLSRRLPAVSDRYSGLVARGLVAHDDRQFEAAKALDPLADAVIEGKKPPGAPPRPSSSSSGFLSALASFMPAAADNPSERGVYLYGGVGTGKTMLMDLLHSAVRDHAASQSGNSGKNNSGDGAGSNSESGKTGVARRTHFHTFMLDAHARIHAWKKEKGLATASNPSPPGAAAGKNANPLPDVASDLAKEASLLCLDEFQVTDIADAMILRGLFEGLFDRGVRVVLTSNRRPEDLYAGGIQRDKFVPFIELVSSCLRVHDIDSARDHRREAGKDGAERGKSGGVRNGQERGIEASVARVLALRLACSSDGDSPFFLTGPDRVEQANALFYDLTGSHNGPQEKVPTMMGRTLVVPSSLPPVARFGFGDLCLKPLGAADYLAIAGKYSVVIVDDVPVFRASGGKSPDVQGPDVARRFVTLVDVLYEHNIKLALTSCAEIEELFESSPTDEKQSSKGTREDVGFAFARTVSRLHEMQSERYLDKAIIEPS